MLQLKKTLSTEKARWSSPHTGASLLSEMKALIGRSWRSSSYPGRAAQARTCRSYHLGEPSDVSPQFARLSAQAGKIPPRACIGQSHGSLARGKRKTIFHAADCVTLLLFRLARSVPHLKRGLTPQAICPKTHVSTRRGIPGSARTTQTSVCASF